MLCTGSVHAQVIGDTAVCVGDISTYYVTPVSGATYSWNISGGNAMSSLVSDSVIISWPYPGSGTIVLTITLPDNSQIFYYLNVNIHPVPAPVISHDPYPGCPSDTSSEHDPAGQGNSDKGHCEKVCKNATISYFTTFNPGSTYSWTVTGEGSITGQTTDQVIVNWDTTAYGTLTVYETNQWGCVDSATICVEKIDLPAAYFTHPASACKNSNVFFNNLSIGGDTYQWYFGDGSGSTIENPNHAYGSGGTYTITLIVINECYCTDTFQSIIHIDSLPGPDITCISTVCANDTATYTTSATGCTYSWVAVGGSIIGPSNTQNITVGWGPGQMGMLGLVITGCGSYCTDTTWAYIPIIPVIGIIDGPSKVCPGACEVFTMPHFSGTTYSWSLNGSSCGSIIDSTGCEEIEICIYFVSMEWPGFLYFHSEPCQYYPRRAVPAYGNRREWL